MFAVVNNKGFLVARDFRTKPEALSWIKQFDTTMRVISQDTQQFCQIERNTRLAYKKI